MGDEFDEINRAGCEHGRLFEGAVYDRLNTMKESLIRLEENMAKVGEGVRKIEGAMDGNGKPGLLVRVDRLEQRGIARRADIALLVAMATAAVSIARLLLIGG